MATYNGEKYLKEQLESILVQTIHDFELIVCDDCSTDSTVKILNEYAAKDARIKIFLNEKKLGFVKNFEKAMELCSGEYIALSDQDDIWLPEHLEILRDNIGNKDLCGANSLLVDENDKELGRTLLKTLMIDFLPENDNDFLFRLLFQNIFQGAAMMFTKELTKKALPVPQSVGIHDWWIALVACRCRGVNYITTPILRYRQHGGNITNNAQFSFLAKALSLLDSEKEKLSINSHLKMYEEYEKIYPDCVYTSEYKKYFQDILSHRFSAVKFLLRNYGKMYLSKDSKLYIARVARRIMKVI